MPQLQIPTADMSAYDRLKYYIGSHGAPKGKDTFTTSPGQTIDNRLREERTPIPNAPPRGNMREKGASLFNDIPPEPSFMDKAKEFIAQALLDPNNIGTVGLVKMPQAQRIIEDITSKFRTKPSWAETRMSQYPPSTSYQGVRGTHELHPPDIYKPPTIHNVPYPGAFTESDLARRLGTYEGGTHHGFYTPKGNRTNLGGDFTHRGGMDELLGYQSPLEYTGSPMTGIPVKQPGRVYTTDLFYENPINRGQTYDLPEMMSDTGLSRAYHTDPRIGDRNYLDFPPNITKEQADSIVRTYGAPPNSSMSLTPPDEIMYKLRDVDPKIYQRYYTDNLRGSGQPVSKLIEQFLSNYAEDLTKYIK